MTPTVVNLPNAISAARIILAPLIAVLPLIASPGWRVVAFVLYVIVAVSDYWDGWLARTRGLVTDLGKALDPLADKLLLVATFFPMLVLQGAPDDPVAVFLAHILRLPAGSAFAFPFVTWFGTFTLPWWVVAVVLGREAFMTAFRGAAQSKGVVIAAIGPAKWKAGMQYVWVGAAYFTFAVVTQAQRRPSAGARGNVVAMTVGAIGVLTLWIAVALTIYSLVLYLRRYGALVRG
jgi:phosphatidylglycerophosphate synthase